MPALALLLQLAPAVTPPSAPASLSPEAAACVRAAVTAPFVPLAERFGHVTRACADLFRDPVCRRAWSTAAAEPPHRRAAHLIEACRAAYCPRLKPAPSLCAGELSPSRLLAESAPLVRAALALDHGPEFAAAMAALVPPPASSPPPVSSPAPASVSK